MVKRGIKEKENENLEATVEKQVDKTKKTTSKPKDVLSKRKVIMQFGGKEVEEEAIVERFKDRWKEERKLSDIKNLKVYYKVEEEVAYFVVNENETVAVSFN